MCFEKRFSKRNSVIRLKSNILAPPKFLPPTKFLVWLCHCLNNKEAKRELKSTTTMKPCPFAPSPNTSEECWQDNHVPPTPRLTLQKVDIKRYSLEAVCWPWLACWSNNAVDSHLRPAGPFNSKALRSCLVPRCSHLPHNPSINNALWTVTGCLRPAPADNLPILAGIQHAELRRKGAALSLVRRAMECWHLLSPVATGGGVGGLSPQKNSKPPAQT